MNKIKLFFAVSAILAVSCTKDIDVQKQSACPAEFTASIADDLTTKTTVEYNGSTYDVKWVANESSDLADQISIKDADGNVGTFYVDALTDGTGKNAHFKNLEGSVSAADYHAVYPAGIYDSENDKYVLPATQTYVSSTAAQEFPMVASSSNTVLAFKNICGIIHLTITNKSDDAFSIESVMISDGAEAMSGDITIDWDTQSISSISGNAGVTLECGTPVDVAVNSSASFNIAVPAGTYEALKVSVTTSDGNIAEFSATKSVTVVKSQYSDFSVKAQELFFDYVYGTTNCYIATPGVATTIDVAPYGVDGDCITKTADPALAPVAKSAKVLWSEAILADNCEDITVDFANIQSAKTFTVTTPSGRYGNAVVTVYGTTDCTGDALWSYHIWVPKVDPTSNLQVYNHSSGIFYAMPMNLGALSFPSETDFPDPSTITYNEDYRGFDYSFGRKDPLKRFRINSSKAIEEVAYSTGSVRTTTKKNVNSFILGRYTSQVKEAIEYVTKHPEVVSIGTDYLLYNWFCKEMGEPECKMAKKLWNSSKSEGDPGNTMAKSVYDPCPSGYKTGRIISSSEDIHTIRGLEVGSKTDAVSGMYYVRYNSEWAYYPSFMTTSPYYSQVVVVMSNYHRDFTHSYCGVSCCWGTTVGARTCSTAEPFPTRCIRDDHQY